MIGNNYELWNFDINATIYYILYSIYRLSSHLKSCVFVKTNIGLVYIPSKEIYQLKVN